MALETATYIDSLNTAWPEGGDQRTTSDDHHRLVKACLQRTFPNITAEMRATAANLNFLTGVAQDVQAFMDAASLSFSAINATISAALTQITTINSDLASKSARITTLENDVASKSARITTLEASLSAADRVYGWANVARSGTALGLPSGWESTMTSTGNYRIVHNLGTTGYIVIHGFTNDVGIGHVVVRTSTANGYEYRMIGYGGATIEAHPSRMLFIRT